MSAADAKRAFDAEVEAYKNVQSDIQKNLQSRQQLLQQSNENEMVLEELGRLDEDSNVYKLIGPALIKQDLMEAKTNVQKRLDYITNELQRLDTHLKSLEEDANKKQTEIMKLQKRQAAQAGPSQPA
eukprot:jgi/Chrzof1/7700/Cz02g33130.t1